MIDFIDLEFSFFFVLRYNYTYKLYCVLDSFSMKSRPDRLAWSMLAIRLLFRK